MSKGQKRKRSLSKAPIKGSGSDNPFDRVKRATTVATFNQKKSRHSKFVNSNADEGLFSQTFNRKAQKLQLYNLNEPIQLTHKSEPIEDHYEDDVSDHSEDDFRYSGDIRNLPQALEEHKQRREIERQVKESQRHLLSKLDSEFEHLDLAKFMRPKRGTLEYSQQKPAATDTNKPDKYDENLRRLMAAPQQSKNGGDLLKQLYAASSVAEKCDIAKRFMSGNYVSDEVADTCIVEIARPLGELLSRQSGHQEFCAYFETLTKFVHYLCQHNTKGYHTYFSQFLGGVYVSFENDVDLSLEAMIVLFLLLKVMKMASALYKGGLVVLEKLMETVPVSEETLSKVRLLLAMAYSVILESGLYMPFFYKLCMRVCTNWEVLKRETVESVLELVTVSLRLLSSRGCHVYPICLHIISPNIAALKLDSPKYDNLQSLVVELLDAKLTPSVLDIYLRPRVDLQIPKYSPITGQDSRRTSAVKEDKEQYKSLKREFLRTSAADAKRRSLELLQKRQKSQDRYKKVVREAMMEQEMLKKEFTKPT